jgi:hypothetical protein
MPSHAAEHRKLTAIMFTDMADSLRHEPRFQALMKKAGFDK